MVAVMFDHVRRTLDLLHEFGILKTLREPLFAVLLSWFIG